MSVALPVLERPQEKQKEEKLLRTPTIEEDNRHNAQISEMYQRLINPETTLRDIHSEEKAPEHRESEDLRREPESEGVHLVENARADSYIFRSDSFVNMRRETIQDEAAQEDSDEEESEDLRPTLTTIQYKTVGVKKADEEGVISNSVAGKRISLTKRDKIIIAVVVAVIVSLLVLIIVNSAIISGLNSDLGSLQTSLAAAKSNYADIQNEALMQEEQLAEAVKEFVQNMVN